jgi:diadenosine tetraphosphate (Ap4A) HIT family hydrolase
MAEQDGAPLDDGDCKLCRDLRTLPSAFVVLETDDWIVFVNQDYLRPGCVWVQAKEHVEGLWAMTDDQAATFGVVTRATSVAMRAAFDAQKIYLVSFGENHPHFHALLIARTNEHVDAADRGLSLVGAYLASKGAADTEVSLASSRAIRDQLAAAGSNVQ